MNFSALVLMQVDKENKFVEEMGSYTVGDGAEYISKFYYNKDESMVSIYFDTKKDVEEWEYTAVYELFNLGIFETKGYKIEEKDDEYNPTWILKFDYIEEYGEMVEKLNIACELIKSEIESVLEEAKNKKEDYI